MFRWLHEDLMRDLFDNVERELTGGGGAAARHGLWARLLVDKRAAGDEPAAASERR